MRLLAVLLMCAATVGFSAIDSSAKWLGMRLPEAEVVWARDVGAATAVGFLGVATATRPGASAFQPIVFVAISGVFCNAAYGLATRMLAGRDSAETTLVWTPLAGVVAMTPLLPWCRVTPQRPLVWAVMALMGASGAFGHWLMILAHQRAPASAMTPFGYTQLLWVIVIGCGVFLAWRERSRGR
jgi:drug/metabolite transporter (DMT)-like permease